jgi:hypothetical protein
MVSRMVRRALLASTGLGVAACTSLLGGFEATGSGGTGGSGPSECVTEVDCNLGDLDATCATAACVDAACVVTPAPKGSECGTDGRRCDGAGRCVACLANGDCAQGTCVDGSCVTKDLGELCGDAKECGSGVCSFGLCCDRVCDGACESCKLPGMEGTCTMAPLGAVGEPACAPYVCDGTSGQCPSSCTNDDQCVDGRFCEPNAKTCELKKANGDVCADDAVCQSGNCYKNSCCSTACACGTCSTGQCVVNVAPGSDPSQECGTGTCDGVTGCTTKGATVFAFGATLGTDSFIHPHAVAVDPNGFSYITGEYAGTVTLGKTTVPAATNTDAFVLKLAPDGELVWFTRITGSFPGIGSQSGKSVVYDAKAEAVFIGGDFTTSIALGPSKFTALGFRNGFVAQLSPSQGDVLQSTVFKSDKSGGIVTVTDVAPDSVTGSLIVGGNFAGEMKLVTDFSSKGGFDAFIVRMGSKFELLADASFGGAGDDVLESLAVNTKGTVHAVGAFSSSGAGSLSFAGKSFASAGSDDGFLAVLDGTATPIKQLSFLAFGSTGIDQVRDVAVNEAGTIFLAGKKTGPVNFAGGASSPPAGNENSDPFVAAFTGKLLLDWVATYATSTPDVAEALALDSKGFVAVGGNFASSLTLKPGLTLASDTGSSDPFVAKLVSSIGGQFEGLPLWGLAGSGSPDIDEVTGIATTVKERDLVVVGAYRGPMSIAGKALPPTEAKAPSMFVARVSP